MTNIKIPNPTLATVERTIKLMDENNWPHAMDVSDIADPEIQNIATQFDPQAHELTQADLFKLLIQVEQGQNVRDPYLNQNDYLASHRLREALNLPTMDPNGVTLSFHTFEISRGTQIGATTIQPQNISNPPLVFFGGLLHKAAVYLPFLTELAKAQGRTIHVVSLPGMGESGLKHGESVTHQLMVEAVCKTVHELIPADSSVALMGHSLGTIPLRHLYHHQKLLDRKVEQWVLVTPSPAEREYKAGLFLHPTFAAASGIEPMVLGKIKPTLLPHFLFNNHPEEEAEWLDKIVGREEFPVGFFNQMEVVMAIDQEPLLESVKKDPKLKLVFAANDRLIPLANPEMWKRFRNVHVLKGADHCFIAGKESSKHWVNDIKNILDQGDSRPPLEEENLYPHTKLALGGTSGMDTHGTLIAGGELSATLALLPNLAGIAALLPQIRIEDFERFRTPGFAQVGLDIAPDADGHISVFTGGQAGYDAFHSQFVPPQILAELRYTIVGAAGIYAQIAQEVLAPLNPQNITGTFGARMSGLR